MFLDNYERIRIVDKIKEKYNGKYKVYEYPKDPLGNPHSRRKPNVKMIVVGADLTIATSGTHAQVSNHAGSAFPLNHKQDGKRCAKPFRELSIRWDGNVALCCNDWTGIYGTMMLFIMLGLNCTTESVILELVMAVIILQFAMDCYPIEWVKLSYRSLM